MTMFSDLPVAETLLTSHIDGFRELNKVLFPPDTGTDSIALLLLNWSELNLVVSIAFRVNVFPAIKLFFLGLGLFVRVPGFVSTPTMRSGFLSLICLTRFLKNF